MPYPSLPAYPDLDAPLRDALVGDAGVIALLPVYKGSFPVFTRRPVPPDAEYPMIVVSPDITKSDEDGADMIAPRITRDVAAYGRNDEPANYRAVEALARAVHDLFHRNEVALSVDDYDVASIAATGPRPGPTDDEALVARIVTLNILLVAQQS